MWVRDLQHNPDPLSPAQTELVARVVAAGLGARQKVEAGELYYWDGDVASSSGDLNEAERLVAAGRAPRAPTSLDAAIDDYLRVYQVYVEGVRPAIRSALDGCGDARLLAGAAAQSCARDEALWQLGAAPSEAALAAYQRRFGMYAPVWDVAVACDAERPDRVLAMAALWQARGGDSPETRRARAIADATAAAAALAPAEQARLATARRALALADLDDEIFFAAQQNVRLAWLREGDPAALVVPPRVAPAPASGARQWQGVGWGAADGRAQIVRSLHDLPLQLPADAILVMPAFLPSHTFLLAMVRAIVVETGGLLSHAAVVAREYGVPHLVGARGAMAIPDGARLRVDGTTATIY